MKIKLDKNAIVPTKAHKTDAGWDLYSPVEVTIPALGSQDIALDSYGQVMWSKTSNPSVAIDTGVHIELPPNTVGMIKSKSGLNVNHGITSEGVIDEGFTGSIVIKLYNNSGEQYTIHKGDKITQLVILPLVDVGELEVVEELEDTERGNNGFGSSGRG